MNPSAERLPSCVGIFLASGRGERFDPEGQQNKLLARLPDGRSVLRAAAENLCAVLDQVIVVTRMDLVDSPSLQAALSGLPVQIVGNPQAHEGMGRSIAVGIGAAQARFPSAAGWIIAMGDMPFIQPATIRSVRAALLENMAAYGTASAPPRATVASIVAPAFQGQRGHPVGFAALHGQELTALTGDQGARDLLQRHPVRLIETSDSGILKDIDTPNDLDAPS